MDAAVIMYYFVLVLLVICLQSSKCSIFSKDTEKPCELNLIEGIKKCEFNFTNGDFDVFSASLPELHRCIEQCPHTELLFRFENYTLPAFPNGTFSNIRSRKLTLEISKQQNIAIFPNGSCIFSVH
ncbi:hypothetical protein TNCT_603731 [Trichonephila clavata]|uniref:Uncharacterized protein n=1 Tax=Trichonephila clavata TaxID=2740835 RepID=A0A8X6G7L3_TRICU|nr:hypothetical protein TNCT_603731 [Trichonephila clavata]